MCCHGAGFDIHEGNGEEMSSLGLYGRRIVAQIRRSQSGINDGLVAPWNTRMHANTGVWCMLAHTHTHTHTVAAMFARGYEESPTGLESEPGLSGWRQPARVGHQECVSSQFYSYSEKGRFIYRDFSMGNHKEQAPRRLWQEKTPL